MSFPNPAHVAVELHAAEHAALVKVTNRIGRKLRLFGERMLAKILGATGRAIAEIMGAMVVPPRALVMRGAVENLEMNVGMFKPDPAQLHEVFGFQPDRKPAVVERLLTEIADSNARDLHAVLIGIKRTDRFPEHLADTVAAVGTRRHVGADAVITRVKSDRVVRRGKDDALDALL